MFSHHSTAARPRGRRVCLVTRDLDRLTLDAAGELGSIVHILFCDERRPRSASGLHGITFSTLGDVPIPNEPPNLFGPCPSDLSDRVRRCLAYLHRQQNFDAILFSAQGGLGFRTLQARQAGLGFQGLTLGVYLDTCSAWQRERQGKWPDSLDDLELDYIERRSFEWADVQIAADPKVLEFVQAHGWQVQPGRVRNEDNISSLPTPLVTVCVPHYNLDPFLPRALESLAAQTYPHLEVLVIDDGSTDEASREAFAGMRDRFPQFRFFTQANSGIGATRNRGLAEAAGAYFVPFDADNLARPDLIEKLVNGIGRRPELGALTCYFLAFEDEESLNRGVFRAAYLPTGGPHVLASLRNVYGDATAIYRTDAFRAVGGYETDRHTSFEDWEAFVKLVQAGFPVDVLPEYLFYYRHRATGFSRVTGQFSNHERVLRQFRQLEALPAPERAALWSALMGFHRKMDSLAAQSRGLRHRLAERVHRACQRVPFMTPALKWLLRPFLDSHCRERIPSW